MGSCYCRSCWTHTIGKRVNKAVADHVERLLKLTEQTKLAVSKLKRLKCSDAEKAAKKAAAEAQLAVDCEALATRRTRALEQGGAAPACAPANRRSGAAASSSTDGVSVTTISDGDAASVLASMVVIQHGSSRSSCTLCPALQEEKLEARKTAAEAVEARRLAEESAARAWAERQVICKEMQEQQQTFELEHSSALEQLKRRHQEALQQARRLRTDAQAEAERLRARAVAAEGHQATLSINSWETVKGHRTAQASLEKAQAEIECLKADRVRQAAMHDEQMQRQRARFEELAGVLQQEKQEVTALKESATSDRQEIETLTSQLHGEKVRRGRAERDLAIVREASSRSSTRQGGGDGSGPSSSGTERSEVIRLKEAIARRDEHIEARDAQLLHLEAQLQGAAAERELLERKLREQRRDGGEGQAGDEATTEATGKQKQQGLQRSVAMRAIRTSISGNAPLEPSSMEIIRRLVDESNVSFSAVPKCVALVWMLISNEPIPEDLLISRSTAINAYLRLDQLDSERAAERRRQDDAPWAFASDGGNKGHAVNLAAISYWNFEERKPCMEPLTLSSLNSDQTARNCADTINAAIAKSGLNPRRCCQGLTDGCEAALQENKLVLAEQHRRHMLLAAAAGEAQQQAQRSRAETCAIHGKALEERAFIEEAFPLVVDALRLLWEIMKGDGNGRVNEYREIWVNKCKFAETAFNSSFANIPEFTLAKWGCMRDGCQALLAVIQRPGRGRRSKIERFLEKCREIFNGTTDETKATRSEHPHREKINVLSGLFKEGTLHAGIYAITDMWDKSFDDFFRFCKSPSRFGGFAPPHLRHMIAEQVARDKVYYKNARQNPVRWRLPSCSGGWPASIPA